LVQIHGLNLILNHEILKGSQVVDKVKTRSLIDLVEVRSPGESYGAYVIPHA